MTTMSERRSLPEGVATEESRRSFGVMRWLVRIWLLRRLPIADLIDVFPCSSPMDSFGWLAICACVDGCVHPSYAEVGCVLILLVSS